MLIDRIKGKIGEKVNLNEVLLVVDGEKRRIGQPQVNSAMVVGTIGAHNRGKKIRVAIYKAKSRYRKVRGHRQSQTLVKIERLELRQPQKSSTDA